MTTIITLMTTALLGVIAAGTYQIGRASCRERVFRTV